MGRSKSLKLFLAGAEADGLRTVEIANMTIHATFFPRSLLKEFEQCPEAERPGVYILLGPEINCAYIGEGDPVKPRLQSHNRSDDKSFWTETIVFTSKDNNLTKTHIQYIESALCKKVEKANNVKLKNTNKPTYPNISISEKSDIEYFIENIELILDSFRYDLLKSRIVKIEPSILGKVVYEGKNKGALAKMTNVEGKYVIIAGSIVVKTVQNSCSQLIKQTRESLLKQGVIIECEDEKNYKFVFNYAFSSPSGAATIVVGGAANGRTFWKFEGKTLQEIEGND